MHAEERDIQRWEEWQGQRTPKHVSDIPSGATRLYFYREGKSHRGIASHKQVTMLRAQQVNQEFLGEIRQLHNLTYLDMDVITAEDLTPIRNLAGLKTLKLQGVRKATNFGPVLELPSLTKLFISNAKHITNLAFLADANQVESLGVEGSMWTQQRIESLKPLSHLRSLRALFMTSVILSDKTLTYLATIPNLRILECANFAPAEQFNALRRLVPRLQCQW
jgi:Leucine-rich repeat (LRR) protein